MCLCATFGPRLCGSLGRENPQRYCYSFPSTDEGQPSLDVTTRSRCHHLQDRRTETERQKHTQTQTHIFHPTVSLGRRLVLPRAKEPARKVDIFVAYAGGTCHLSELREYERGLQQVAQGDVHLRANLVYFTSVLTRGNYFSIFGIITYFSDVL